MKEPIEDIGENRIVDIEGDDKLHVLYGGTKVVQHTPPTKNSFGLRCMLNINLVYNNFCSSSLKLFYF